ncbi:MAG: Brp/Blh family beta-carotene 15,15'-monooxygenase [Paraglaciecola sp.]|jgi:Brp/Blh family beta-carotene 15,15'-monooxygenase
MSIANYRIWVSLATVLVISLSVALPSVVELYGGYSSILLILFLGIPHGATDYILFRHINGGNNKKLLTQFFCSYFLLMGLFGLVWWMLPSLALMIFLAISIYHFGQSEWHYLKVDKVSRKLLYCSWGAFALFTPLLWNYEETAFIVENIIDIKILLSTEYQIFIPVLLIAFIVIQTLVLAWRKKISRRKLAEGWGALLLLTVLFYCTSLMVGFAIYFVFWHSIDSIKDQFTQLRETHSEYTFGSYLKQVIPFTLVAFGGIGFFTWFSPAVLMSGAWIGQFFVLISVVTLPHSLLMDSFLEPKTYNITMTKHRYKKQSREANRFSDLKNFLESDFSRKLKSVFGNV